MKLKAVVHADAPQGLIDGLQERQFRKSVLDFVLHPFLHVPKDFGSAEFYVQHCDLAESEPFCEARLTGVSVTKKRSTDNYHEALEALELVYKATLEKVLPHGQSCQLMVSMMLDKIPFGETSSLIEREPIRVHSQRISTKPA